MKKRLNVGCRARQPGASNFGALHRPRERALLHLLAASLAADSDKLDFADKVTLPSPVHTHSVTIQPSIATDSVPDKRRHYLRASLTFMGYCGEI